MHSEADGYYDETESYRRQRQADLNADTSTKSELEQKYGQVWTTTELTTEFEVIGFMAPYVTVKRLSDNQKGSLEFRHAPRYYFSFHADKGN